MREPIKNFSQNKKQKFREIQAHISLMNRHFKNILVCPVFGTDGLRMADYGYPIRDGFRLDGFLMLHNHSKYMPSFRAVHKFAQSPLFSKIKAPYYGPFVPG